MDNSEPDGRSPIDWTGSIEQIEVFPQTAPMKRFLVLPQSDSQIADQRVLPFIFRSYPFYTHGSRVTCLMLIIGAFMSGLLLPYIAHSFIH